LIKIKVSKTEKQGGFSMFKGKFMALFGFLLLTSCGVQETIDFFEATSQGNSPDGPAGAVLGWIMLIGFLFAMFKK